MAGRILAFSALAAVASAQSAAPDPSFLTLTLAESVNSYLFSVANSAPGVASFLSHVGTELPSDALTSIEGQFQSAIQTASAGDAQSVLNNFATSTTTSIPTPSFLSALNDADRSQFMALVTGITHGEQSVVAGVLGLPSPSYNDAPISISTGAAMPAVTARPVYKLAGGVLVGVGMAAAVL